MIKCIISKEINIIFRLNILCEVWNKDSNYLFDYESNEYSISSKTINTECYLMKNENEVKYIIKKNIEEQQLENESIYGDSKYLGYINKTNKEEYFWNYNPYKIKSLKRSYESLDWLVIGKTFFSKQNKPNTYYKLRKGDLIKFGKIIFLVREIKNTKTKENILNRKTTNYYVNETSVNVNEKLKNMYIQIKQKSKNENKIKVYSCRICLQEGDLNGDNPLINPCNCTGSVKYIHLICLRKWLTSKIIIKHSYDNSVTSYSYKPFECELCKEQIPERIKYNNEIISLIEMENLNEPYIIFENIYHNNVNYIGNYFDYQHIFIVHFNDKNRIKIGRSNDADMRLSDISVSRTHAFLHLKNNEFYLEDCKSKFGSLLLIQNKIMFIPDKPLSIQIGRFHLNFIMNRTFISCFKCYKNKLFNQLNYDNQLNSSNQEIYNVLLNGLKKIITQEFSLKDDSNLSQSIKSTKRERDNSLNFQKNDNNLSNINDISSNVQLLSEQTFLKLNDNKSTKNIINNKNLINIDKENKKENNDDMILSNSQQNLIERFNIISKTFTNKQLILNFDKISENYNKDLVTPIKLERSLTKYEKKK